MAQQFEGAEITAVAGAALEPYRLVKRSSGKVTYAGVNDGDSVIGVTATRAAEDGDLVTVVDIKAPGTRMVETAGAIAVDGTFICAANGTIQAETSPGDAPVLGQVWRAATTAAGGDIVEAYFYNTAG